MTKNLQSVFSDSMIYWVGTMLSKMMGFFLIPLYTRFLSPEDYGVLELVALTTDLFAILIGAQISSAVFKLYHDEDDEKRKRQIISTSVVGVTVFSGLSFLILFLNAELLSTIIFDTNDNAELFRLMFIGYFFSVVQQVPLAYIRILDKSKLFVIVTLIQLFLMISMNVVFVAVYDLGVYGILLGTAIAFTITGLILVYQTLVYTGVHFKLNIFNSAIRFSYPLIPATLAMFVINFSDRFFLNEYSTLNDVGIYSLSYKFGFLLMPLIVMPFYMTWQSKMYVFYKEENRNELYNSAFSVFFFILSAVFLFITAYIEEILWLMTTEKYYEAAYYVPIIGGAYLINGVSQIFSSALYAEKKTKSIAMINMVVALINIFLNIVLISRYGVLGASLATLISYALVMIMTLSRSNKLTKIRWDIRRYMKLVVITVLVVILVNIVSVDSIFAGVLLKIAILLSALFVVFKIGYFTESQIAFIKRRIPRL